MALSITDIGKQVITTLPPAFVMLCLINVVFLWIVFSFAENQSDKRLAIVEKIIERCLATKLP